MVYEALTGHIPFDASTEAEMMRGHLEMPVRPMAGVDPKIDEVVRRALAKDPAARFTTVEEFADAIGASVLERRAPMIIRDKILARVPPPLRPTAIYVPPATGDYVPGLTPATDLIHGGGQAARGPGKRPAVLLSIVAMGLLSGLGVSCLGNLAPRAAAATIQTGR